MKRLFLFPTGSEAEPFRRLAPEAEIRISGVGAAETAVAVARALREGYDDMVLAGIAGTYDDRLEIGSTVAVCEERASGLPAAFAKSYPAVTLPQGMRAVVSNTVACCGAQPDGAQIENMEGSVFFAMCRDAGIRFSEVRAISNRVGEPREKWRITEAVDSLAGILKEKFMHEKIKLRISPCPNDTFAFDALINGRIDTEGLSFEVEFADIEELNRGVLDGSPDVSKISTSLLASIAGRYELLDSGSALGRGNGQLLVRRKGDTLPIRTVAIPGEHTTANAMLKLFFPALTDRRPMLFSLIAEAVERGDCDAGVLIHEGRFVYERRNLELVADLGAMWEQRTGLPLPLGAIVARRDLPETLRRKVERLIAASVEYAFAHPAASREFVKAYARELDDDVIDKHISLFVNEYTVSLGDEGRKAVALLGAGKQD